MSNLEGLDLFLAIMVALLEPFLLTLCFNYSLNFFQSLHKSDDHLANKNKIAATICLSLFFFLPVVFFIYTLIKNG
ncbi:hypothetical protein BED47_00675 [Gottfriedia luciferensis]|uniref:Uncharacterized protein n=1 Tax=Gottfriedia luciferensis TaxID=178774 RepID=A0ABX2ZW15_9BACI|nr:hypothetical protein [Gottfriedia luciferensis]ODG93718.1 hypothetical protein BED47_00675 [Gottfriedia luciferensis]